MRQTYFDWDGQADRRKTINDLVADYTLHKFDEKGKWMGKSQIDRKPGQQDFIPGLRERYWFAASFFETRRPEASDKANLIIRTSETHRCEFAPMAALQLLTKYDQWLDDISREALKQYLLDSVGHFTSNSMDFVGVNDNFPSMSTYTALIGGTILNRVDIREKGRQRLKQFKKLLQRRGVATEYNSPTYSSIQLCAMAEIANYEADAELRQLALQIEERLWVDMLGHYHHESSQVAGPYSRAYTVDSVGHTHQSRFVLYALLGDRMKVNPLNTLFARPDGEAGEVIHGWPEFMQVSTAWIMNTEYHCPERLIELAFNKPYPYLFLASTEFASSTDASPFEERRDPYVEDEIYEYPAGSGTITTYMTQDYALGVASNEFHRGAQTDSFHILYRKRPVECQADIGTVYARYIVNEEEPSARSSMLDDRGRKIGIQHRNTAVLLYKPSAYARTKAASLKLSLVFPAMYSTIDEIWLGEKRVEDCDGESIEPCPVYVKDGNVYMAFFPLLLTDYGRKAAVKVRKNDDFMTVSFYNYEGETRDFARRGFLLTGNGFVTEIRNSLEAGSFEEFRCMFNNAEIRDELFQCAHTRQTYLRRLSYIRDGLTVECEYSPVSEGIRYIAINGNIPPFPKLEITGLETVSLPFMHE